MPRSHLPTRVLIIDDDEDDFLITTDYIKSIEGNNFLIEWCPQYNEALQRISRKEYDIYFVDYRLGAKTGLDLLKAAIAMQCEQPIVLLTGKGNPKVDKEAMEVGAFDYLIKSELNAEKLERCIRYSLERAASLKALKANERKYRNVFEKSKDAIFILDEALRFKDINLATSELLNYTREEMLQRNLYELIPLENIRQKIVADLREFGEVVDLEVPLNDSLNEKKICILSMAIQEDEGQGGRYIQGIVHDITNIRKAEKVTLQAEKLAATGRLVRTLTHEVRNPLSNIQMSVEQLENLPLQDDDKIFLDIIKRNSKRINALITELLNSSRPAEMIYRSVALQSVLQHMLQDAHDRITLKQIRTSFQFPEQACIITGDEEKLRIALLNVLINATEAVGEQGRVDVFLSAKPEQYRVEISDNGQGISPENLSRLFEPYFTSKRNGMGLGLASTLNILQAHHCMVDVKSQVNEGTTFSISFPRLKD